MSYEPTMSFDPQPPPAPPPRRLSGPAIIGIAVGVIVLLVCGLFAYGLAIRTNNGTDVAATTTPDPSRDGGTQGTAPTTRANDATILVPDGVGLDYQSAQDLWREAGLHVAPAIDALGAHRLPIVDKNWVVVSQEPKAGAEVQVDSFITATVKKFTDN